MIMEVMELKMNRILRKIYVRKNNFLKVYCVCCGQQVDLIWSFVNWFEVKIITHSPRWYVRWQLHRSGVTDEMIEASRQRMLKMIESKMQELKIDKPNG